MEMGNIVINGKEFPVGKGDYLLKMNDEALPVTEQVANDIKEWVLSGHKIQRVEPYPTCPHCRTAGDRDWEYCPYDGHKLELSEKTVVYEIDRYGNKVD